MKKYALFIISFAALYMVFQLLSGWALTTFYTPNFSSMEESGISQKVIFGETSNFPFIFTLLTATLAYLLSLRFGKDVNDKNKR